MFGVLPASLQKGGLIKIIPLVFTQVRDGCVGESECLCESVCAQVSTDHGADARDEIGKELATTLIQIAISFRSPSSYSRLLLLIYSPPQGINEFATYANAMHNNLMQKGINTQNSRVMQVSMSPAL